MLGSPIKLESTRKDTGLTLESDWSEDAFWQMEDSTPVDLS
jgi:hypothetical protein